MYKKFKVVMVTTDKKAPLFIGNEYRKLHHTNNSNVDEKFRLYQHLYIISDESIKRGDWVYRYEDNKVFKSEHNFSADYCENLLSKIIATTDSSLSVFVGNQPDGRTGVYDSLPGLPNQFIKDFINEHNNGNKVRDVLIEYLNDLQTLINLDNTVNIKIPTESYPKEVVKDILSKIRQVFSIKI